ncbi:MAG: hypothetical protein Q9181_006678 [Wetmoreana brouardii]
MDLGRLLVIRHQQTGSMEDFERSIEVSEQMIKAMPLDHIDRTDRPIALGKWSYQRFQRFRSIKDIDRVVRMNEEVVSAVSLDNPDRAGHLNNLGLALEGRFEQTRSMEDLDRAVKTAEKSVAVSPHHPKRGAHLTNLENCLGLRSRETGSLEDLNRAVGVCYESIQTTSFDHPDRAGFLSNLGNWLELWFERTSSMEDLDSAVEVAEESVKITSLNDDPFEAATHLHNLGNWLGRRFARSRSIDDLNCAVKNIEESISAIPSNYYPTRAGFLTNLGIWLGERFKQTRSIEDLDRAVQVTCQSVELTPLDHKDRAGSLMNLSVWLGSRFRYTDSMEDLDHAIGAVKEALKITPSDHFARASLLNYLGRWLDARSERTGSREDCLHALSAFEEAWSCSNAPPSRRIQAARHAVVILASESNWEKSSTLLQGAVELLPLLSPLTLQHEDQQFVLASSGGIASAAASVALNAGKRPYDALRLLEIGRSVITGLLLDVRSDVSDLENNHPDLAARFISLRNELDSPVDREIPLISNFKTTSRESEARRRREAHEMLNKLIEEIRAQPGFTNFLLPPTAHDLMAASDPDPIIVINLSALRHDAFLVEHHQIRVLQLSNLDLGWFQERFQEIEKAPHLLLEWLWDVVAGPCLEALGFETAVSDDNWPHVWWITTGTPFSNLPIHAAGRHVVASHGTIPVDTVLDRVMSSYSSSIKAIIHGRRHSIEKSPVQHPKEALLIAMQVTAKQSALPSAQDEIAVLERLCPSLQLRPNKPWPNRKEVLAHLQTCEIFHFAGHGQSDPLDPSQSSLFLEDWEVNPLTVRDLRDLKLQKSPPFLAYLSACSTGVNSVAKLGDEGIRLISACQFAGFRHVIGTFLEVPDEYCSAMAETFYQTTRNEGLTDRAVYRRTHRAVRALRDTQMGPGHESKSRKKVNTDPEMKGRATDGTLIDEEDDLGNHAANDLSQLSWAFFVHFGV